MCFVNDNYDWYAQVVDQEFMRAEKQCTCDECRSVIEAGEWCEQIFMQEHEECQLADECSDYYDVEHCCTVSECDYGETYEAHICVNCLKLLQAIWIVEEEEGCPEGTRRPSYGGLWEEVFSYCVDNTNKYIAQWREIFPGVRHRFVTKYEESKANGN